MSFNSKQYLAHEERLLEPGHVVSGTYRRYKELSAQAEKNKWLDNMSPADRQQLKEESNQQYKNEKYA